MNPFQHNQPHYPAYEVVHAHAGEVISRHRTRSAAEHAKTDHAHRVRGSKTPVKA